MTTAQIQTPPHCHIHFHRTTDSTITNHYNHLAIQINCTTDGCCEAIKLIVPASSTLQDKPLIGQSFAEIRTWL